MPSKDAASVVFTSRTQSEHNKGTAGEIKLIRSAYSFYFTSMLKPIVNSCSFIVNILKTFINPDNVNMRTFL